MINIRHNHKGKVIVDQDGKHLFPVDLTIHFFPQVDIVQADNGVKAAPEKKMGIGDKVSFDFGGYNITIKKMNDTGFIDKKIIKLSDRRRARLANERISTQ